MADVSYFSCCVVANSNGDVIGVIGVRYKLLLLLFTYYLYTFWFIAFVFVLLWLWLWLFSGWSSLFFSCLSSSSVKSSILSTCLRYFPMAMWYSSPLLHIGLVFFPFLNAILFNCLNLLQHYIPSNSSLLSNRATFSIGESALNPFHPSQSSILLWLASTSIKCLHDYMPFNDLILLVFTSNFSKNANLPTNSTSTNWLEASLRMVRWVSWCNPSSDTRVGECIMLIDVNVGRTAEWGVSNALMLLQVGFKQVPFVDTILNAPSSCIFEYYCYNMYWVCMYVGESNVYICNAGTISIQSYGDCWGWS